MPSKLTTETFIEKARKVHGDRYDYSKVEYVNSTTEVEIICPEHGSFWQKPKNHLYGQKCPKCHPNARWTTKKFIEAAREVHGDRYDYSKVEYINNETKVCIICKEHGEFWQTPISHINSKHDCPQCAKRKFYESRNMGRDEFIRRAKEVQSKFGREYDYSKVDYVNINTKVCIICNECGKEFWQTPANHLKGKGCPDCKGKRISLMKADTKEEFIKKAKSVHGDKYDYSRVKYINNHIKVEIICNKCGNVFWQTPGSHLNGRNCPKCARESSSYEDYLYGNLLDKFDESDIEREYKKDERYPYHCDFYIKSLDLFVEVNGFFTHGDHWFDENNPNDLVKLNKWKTNGSAMYMSAIKVWTQMDVEKRETAKANNLNYVVLWDKDDISEWLDSDCPVRQDWK